MCIGCWHEYGSPTTANDKTKAALELIKAVYDQPTGGAGGNLHIVIDDWNLETESIQWCVDQKVLDHHFGKPIDVRLTRIERDCADALLGMTLHERASTLARYDEFIS